RGVDARVVGNAAGIILGNVQVGADEYALAAQVEIGHPQDGHGINSLRTGILECQRAQGTRPGPAGPLASVPSGRNRPTSTLRSRKQPWYPASGSKSPIRCRTRSIP